MIVAGIGGKMYMDNQENKKIEQERKIAVQAKGMFKDIKEIRVENRFESSPGTINFNLVIYQITGNKFSTSLTLGDSDSGDGREAFNQRGETEKCIFVIFSNGNSEEI
ncbi:MAG: hypothetical protein ABF991_12345 [Liquorilactobacillus hordei]|uniref:hypothetical protein n=1 Tax=Liquorilactobacillus hordei TaxID=468911 RepID=UPI0039E8B7D0